MNSLSFVPITGAVLGVVSFFTSYIVAVARNDVYPWWPYISDTGTTVPESCIFGELLSLTAFFALCTMIVRYKWVQVFSKGDRGLNRMNTASLTIGCLSCFFMTMVANFQETSVRLVHMPVSACTFGFGLVYNFFHSEITRKMTPHVSRVSVWVLRLTLCVTSLIAFGLLYGFGASANQIADWSKNQSNARIHWNPEDSGWKLHLVSTISEWIVGFCVILYFLTYSLEFRNFSLRLEPQLAETFEHEDNDAAPLMI
ncbi:DNA damage-regulated autophagy modulator protein 2-like [Watersipora subatra]|uniref:DNA damage-regulated autophagy modulator protein 2-like n=1 Tax=Watersipora subatra TaxID=2589382 RepID=UPI00355B5F8E